MKTWFTLEHNDQYTYSDVGRNNIIVLRNIDVTKILTDVITKKTIAFLLTKICLWNRFNKESI